MSEQAVTTSIDDGVAVVRIDDGKANALSHEVIDALHAALDRANDDAESVCIIGREGKLCAGFDLSVMTQGGDATRGLVRAGGELLMRLYGFGHPTVVAVTGHALAAGALMVLACDTRIGTTEPAKIGLNETAIGIGLPAYAVALAHDRLSKRHLTRSMIQSEIHDPSSAVDAGFIDRVVDPADLESTAIAEARRLGEFSSYAYSTTKRKSRQATIAAVLDGLDADMADIVPPTTT